MFGCVGTAVCLRLRAQLLFPGCIAKAVSTQPNWQEKSQRPCTLLQKASKRQTKAKSGKSFLQQQLQQQELNLHLRNSSGQMLLYNMYLFCWIHVTMSMPHSFLLAFTHMIFSLCPHVLQLVLSSFFWSYFTFVYFWMLLGAFIDVRKHMAPFPTLESPLHGVLESDRKQHSRSLWWKAKIAKWNGQRRPKAPFFAPERRLLFFAFAFSLALAHLRFELLANMYSQCKHKILKEWRHKLNSIGWIAGVLTQQKFRSAFQF